MILIYCQIGCFHSTKYNLYFVLKCFSFPNFPALQGHGSGDQQEDFQQQGSGPRVQIDRIQMVRRRAPLPGQYLRGIRSEEVVEDEVS